MIPVANPSAGVRAMRAGINASINRVLDSGRYIGGGEVYSFEQEFAAWHHSDVHCAAVASGTDALTLALRAVGVQPKDEVITVSHSAVATVAAIENAGAVPVLADIDSTRCITEALDPLISSTTRAIVPVHVFGHPANMAAIIAFAEEHGLMVIEDCAQAHGATIQGQKVGTFGHAGAFSFYPTKNLGTLGDGGAVISTVSAVIAKVSILREYGWRERFISSEPGINSRLDPMQAAILRLKLPYLEESNERRRAIAERYNKACQKNFYLDPPKTAVDCGHVFHLYVIETDNRDDLRKYLHSHNIDTAVHYPQPIHCQPAYAGRIRCGTMTETMRLYNRMLSIPMYPELTDDEVNHICEKLELWSNRSE